MQYFGGKHRIAKPICEFLNSSIEEGQTFVDLFCGSCNVVSNIRQDVKRYANDKNIYLRALFTCLQQGMILPEDISVEDYYRIKEMPERSNEDLALKAFVGFGCSFAGKWWGGYARNGRGDNYAKNAFNSIMKKSNKMRDVVFSCMDYSEFQCSCGSLVYCDIPYKGTTQYSSVGAFDHESFYAWAKKKKDCRILVSEYKHNVPDGGQIVWEYASKKEIRNKDGGREETVEVLFEFV